jgi:hypothetical protein
LFETTGSSWRRTRCRTRPTIRERDARERKLRLRLVPRARAAGHPPPRIRRRHRASRSRRSFSATPWVMGLTCTDGRPPKPWPELQRPLRRNPDHGARARPVHDARGPPRQSYELSAAGRSRARRSSKAVGTRPGRLLERFDEVESRRGRHALPHRQLVEEADW